LEKSQPESQDEPSQSGDLSPFAATSELKPATYLVTCSTALLPPATITDLAVVNIARNIVLTDADRDAVKTTVIEPFMVSTDSTPPTDLTTLDGFGDPRTGSLPPTGDLLMTIGRAVAILALIVACVLLPRRRPRSSPPHDRN
jgi:hypothetical protein